MTKDNRTSVLHRAVPVPLLVALGWAGAIAVPCMAQSHAGDLSGRFQAWRLEVATGVLTPEARAELDALAVEAKEAAAASGASKAVQATWAQIEAEQVSLAPKVAPGNGANGPSSSGPGFSGLGSAAQGTPEEEVLSRSILDSLKSGNRSFITRLGKRAVPSLQALARTIDGSPTPEGQLDPLDALLSVDSAAGLDLALELMGSSSFLIKRHTANLIKSKFGQESLYEPKGATDWAIQNPEWLQIPIRAFEEPAIGTSAMRGILGELAERGLLPRELRGRAIEARAYDHLPQVEPASGIWFLENLLSHPSPKVRLRALGRLHSAGLVLPTLALTDDPDREVRMAIGSNMLSMKRKRYTDRRELGRRGESEAFYPPLDPPLFAAFKVLAMSDDENLALAVWNDSYNRLGVEGAQKMNAEQLRELIPLAKTTYQLAAVAWHATALPEDQRLAIVVETIEAAGTRGFDADQVERLLSTFVNLATGDLKLPANKSFWPIMGAIEKALPVAKMNRGIAGSAATLAGNGEVEAAPLIDWLEDHGDHTHWYLMGYQNGEQVLNPWLRTLTQAQRARVVKSYGLQFAKVEKPGVNFEPAVLRRGILIQDPEVLAGLVADREASASTRNWALEEIYRLHGDSVEASLVDSIADALVQDGRIARVSNLLGQAPGAAHVNRVMRSILRHPKCKDELVLNLNVAPDKATFDALVKRFPMESWGALGYHPQIWRCIQFLVRGAETELPPILSEVTFADDNIKSLVAAEIGAVRSPALFPLACRIMAESRSGSNAWAHAVDAVAGYFSEDAAAALLEAAKAAHAEESRLKVMTALRQITEWREAAAAWERSVGAEAKRAGAIEALIATLDDPKAPLEARAASMRGLGLLGAVEELPRIIAALASSEDEMKAAARAALARLEE